MMVAKDAKIAYTTDMRPASSAAVLFGLVFLGAFVSISCGGCEKQPDIVIRFDARDLSQPDATTTARDAASSALVAPTDAAVPPPAKGVSAPKAEKAALGARAQSPLSCASDADCVIVPDGCCGCANGGKQKAVAKRDEAKVLAARRTSCKDVMCTMMVSSDPTCGKRATCLEGECAMRDARPDEQKTRLPKRAPADPPR